MNKFIRIQIHVQINVEQKARQILQQKEKHAQNKDLKIIIVLIMAKINAIGDQDLILMRSYQDDVTFL